jgi:hypothetical protein
MKSILEGFLERVVDLWCLSGLRAGRITMLFVVGLAVICGGCALIGAVPTFVFGHDDFFLLENGWRVLNGLRPQLDFWSPWGPVAFVVVGMGLKLSHGSANGIAFGSAMFALVTGLWTYGVGRNLLQPIPRALLALYGAALACAPYPLGMAPMALSHAMIYNRYGYALLVPLLLECFPSQTRQRTNREEWLSAASTGAVLALVLFLKASYFLVGGGIVAASFILSIATLRRFLGILAGFLSVSLVCIAYLRFQLGVMIRALYMAAGARAQSLSLKTIIYNVIMQALTLFCIVGLAILVSFAQSRRPRRFGDLSLPFAAIVIYLADIGLFSTNAQSGGLPLLGAFAILLANRVAEFRNDSPNSGQQFALPFCAALLLVSGILFLPQFASDVAAIPIAAVRELHPYSGCSVRFTELRVRSLWLCDSSMEGETQQWSNGRNYTTYVNDGVALLHRCCDANDRVLAMDMQNPFPFVLGWRPPRGGMAATAYNYTLSDKFRPSMDEYFGDATVVMIPKHPAIIPLYADRFYEIYVPEVKRRYELVDETDWFWVYKRN